MSYNKHLYNHVDLKTIARLDEVHPESMNTDEFVNRLLDHYLGIDCNHSKQGLYLRLPVDENHMLDKDAAFALLNRICFGEETPNLVRGCPDCGRMSIVKRC